MNKFWTILLRATLADAFLVLSFGALVWAFLSPLLSARDFRRHVEAVVAHVDAVSGAARRVLTAQGSWPSTAPPGQELPGSTGLDSPFARVGYTLAWGTWLVVDSVQAPPEPLPPPTPGDAPRQPPRPRMVPVNRAVGAVRVHTRDDALLAELLQHYGAASFVLDTVWVLVLPERSAPPAS